MKELHPIHALLDDGRRLDFDFAAVCTGSSQQFGKGGAATIEERRAELKVRKEGSGRVQGGRADCGQGSASALSTVRPTYGRAQGVLL